MKQTSKRTQAPKQLRAIQTSRHLHMAPHKHTGHLTHRRTTSYPTLAMIVLCLGVFLASWTRFVTADTFVYPGPVTNSYVVHASVPGPPPSDPATIDNPINGAKFSDIPITVSGSCPVGTYETLYRNGAFSGVALCDADGHYELQTGLFPGTNQLQVKDFSPTDVGGPLSNMVTVTYNPPTPPPPPSSGSTTSETNSRSTTNTSGPVVAGEPLIFKTTFVYEGHYVGATSSWQLDLEGGSAPYAISVDWGDGEHSLLSRPRAGTFNVDHTYKKAGGYRGSYVTKFSASDSDSTQTFLQLLAIVNNPPNGITGGATNGSSGSSGVTLNPLKPGFGSKTQTYVLALLKYIWPSYGLVVLLLASFWLGERREYQHLRPRLKKTRHA